MKENFLFKLSDDFIAECKEVAPYLGFDTNDCGEGVVFTANILPNKEEYNVSWYEEKGGIVNTTYSKDKVKENLENNIWLIVEE